MRIRLRWEQDVAACVASRPHLLPLFGDVCGVTDYLRDWNPDLFIVLNLGRVLDKLSGAPYQDWRPLPIGIVPKWNAWWEIHNLREKPTLVMSVRDAALDYRTVLNIRKSDIRVHGTALFAEMEAANAHLEAQMRRDSANEIDALARDTHSAFARAYWGPSQFGPGGPPKSQMWAPDPQRLISTSSGVHSLGR